VVALILARLVGPDGHVVAVEAEPHNALVARANMAANDARNVTVLHAAGAAREGVVLFTEGLNGTVAARGAAGSVEVPAVTVDALADRFGPPDVVLVDVEGHEGHVLDGATRTIAAGATDFFVELHDTAALAAAGSTAAEVLAHFELAGFDVAVAVPGPADDAGSRWRDAAFGEHLRGQRCFVVARPRAPRAQALTPTPQASVSRSGSDSRP
jgi:FkbM family methyltransferase